MERLRNELADLSKRKRSLMEIRDEKKLMLKMDEIMADQNRVKEYIHEYVTQIVLYKPDPSWDAVRITFRGHLIFQKFMGTLITIVQTDEQIKFFETTYNPRFSLLRSSSCFF